MIIYLDTSALLKRYVQEIGSAWLIAQCEPATGNLLATALISKAEAIAGLAAKFRQGGLLPNDYHKAEQDLLHDFTHSYHLIDIQQTAVDLAGDLAKRQKLRGYDAVQLAAGLTLQTILLHYELPPLLFISADMNLLQAAQSEGLNIDNPNWHP